MESVNIPNPKKLEKTKKAIVQDGVNSLHILADFDRTLTKASINGRDVPSLISVLRDYNYLTSDYPEEAKALFRKYRPIEINPEIPKEEKMKAMEEWWKEHYDLLIKSKLNRKDIENVINSGRVEWREGALEFLDFLKKYNIPLVIISSSGLGTLAISLYFKKSNKLSDNVHIVSNEFEWDENGYLIRIKMPLIHSLNKNEIILKNFPFFEEIENRPNVILLADSPDDINMKAAGFCKELISIGFLNKKVKSNLEQYKNIFDVIITSDSEMKFVNDLLKDIFR